MSQSFPPPQQPGQQPGQFDQAQQPQGGFGYPMAPMAPPAAPVRNNFALGLIAAIVAALVTAGIYGAIIGATKHEIGYAAVGVGFLVGFAAGKAGGRNPALPVIGAVLSLVAVYFGQLLGEAIIASKELPVTVSELFFQHFSLLNEAWKADADPLTFLFFAIAAVAAFSGAKKASV
ncbi:hypothetical protein [Streptomyces sp. NPDC051994]|uniref:hypothetical protein n=1 Tax=unclassified Streptomyces TaxID=2593676 RepID=UPI0034462E89